LSIRYYRPSDVLVVIVSSDILTTEKQQEPNL
jgi:hypothetical protein